MYLIFCSSKDKCDINNQFGYLFFYQIFCTLFDEFFFFPTDLFRFEQDFLLIYNNFLSFCTHLWAFQLNLLLFEVYLLPL